MATAPPKTLEEFDRLVQEFYHSSSGSSQKERDTQLNQFSKNPDSITHVQEILQTDATQPETKYLALQVLDNVINTRWNTIGTDSCLEIRNFVAGRIITECQQLANLSPDQRSKRRVIINKLNTVLIQIVKKEWPNAWPTFIPEILDSSRRDQFICENNMVILRILSEEVYDFSEDHLTAKKARELRASLTKEAPGIYQLCIDILTSYIQSRQENQGANDPQKPLIVATLETLNRFLSWMEPQFRVQAIEPVRWFLRHHAVRNHALKCLVEISSIEPHPDATKPMAELLINTLKDVAAIVPLELELASIYPSSNQSDQQFVQNLAMFLTALLGKHLRLLEPLVDTSHINHAHQRLLQISEVDDREIFKVCLEYWSQLAQDLYNDMNQNPLSEIQSINPLATMGIPELSRNGLSLRKDMHSQVLSKLRVVIIKKMARPEEVLIVENEAGEIVREFVKESDTVQLYKSSRECLVFLTHLDVEDTKDIMTRKLEAQVSGEEWSWANCNSLCWAIGSISGAMDESTEKQFLVIVIKDLLTLTEQQRGKDNKAVVASNIMYIVGQYPRFLKAHWKFLKTVVNKLFEFMHETHEGVQDMACDTFIKISNKCRRHFVVLQTDEDSLFIENIFVRLNGITSALTRQQVHTFYEACGFMISAESDMDKQRVLVSQLMHESNQQWEALIQTATADDGFLRREDALDALQNIIKTNIAVCRSVGSGFFPQLFALCTQLLQFYDFYSNVVNDNLSVRSSPVAPVVLTKSRSITRETCNLLNTFFTRMTNNEAAEAILPHITPILAKYRQVVPDARDYQALSLFTTVVSKFPNSGNNSNSIVLECLFNPTLEMIKDDITRYPEFRLEFYNLLLAFTKNDFNVMLSMEPSAFSFELFMLSVFGAMKHNTSEIGNIGLDICLQLLEQVARRPADQANMFFAQYLARIFEAVLSVLVDPDHKAGFSKQTILIRKTLLAIRSGQISVPIYAENGINIPNSQSMGLVERNLFALTNCAGQLFRSQYPHLNEQQVIDFMSQLSSSSENDSQFRQIIRDFLITLCEFPSQSDKLFAEEKQVNAAEAERARAMQVGGLWKPSDFDDDEL